MRLVNVRLDEDDARMAAELRREGVQLSGIVREALRAAYAERRGRRRRARPPSAIVAEIYAQLPDPPGARPPGYDLLDRHSVRRAIAKRIRAGRA